MIHFTIFLVTEGGSIFKMKPSSSDTIQKYDTSSSTHNSSHASHHGLITPIIVSSVILVFILIFGCIICSKESFHVTRNRHSSPGQNCSSLFTCILSRSIKLQIMQLILILLFFDIRRSRILFVIKQQTSAYFPDGFIERTNVK